MRKEILLPVQDCARVRQEIGEKVVTYCVEHGINGLVLGLSGGVDSTVTGTLIHDGFTQYNVTDVGVEKPLELIGYILPSKTNNAADVKDAIHVAKKLGIRYRVIDIEPITRAHMATDSRISESEYDKGNMMSRIRAGVLHTQAALEGMLVAGTGNKDEDASLGYFTTFGDGAAHISVISALSKRLVKEQARYAGFDTIAKRTPTPGLEPGQTDFGDLGYSYDLSELFIHGLEQGFSRDELIMDPVVNTLAAKDRANYTTEFGASKFESTEEMIDDMFQRHKSARKKLSLVQPYLVPVTLEYLPASKIHLVGE